MASKVENFAPFVRSPYNYDVKAASIASGLSCPEPTLAQQQFKDDSDPNFIMKQFARGIDITKYNVLHSPQYGDFTGVSDYQSAPNAVIQAELGFNELPAEVRARFENDPGRMLDFLNDPKNRDEASELGLLKPELSTSGSRSTKGAVEPVVGNSGDAPVPSVKPLKKGLSARLKTILDDLPPEEEV